MRVRKHYKSRARKAAYKRGHTDKGTYADEQEKCHRELLLLDAVEEARLEVEHNQRIHDFVEILKGQIQ
jgi:hypothetical protein